VPDLPIGHPPEHKEKASVTTAFHRFARPIAVIAAIAAVAGIGLGIAVESTASDASAMASPLAMIAMGASLAGLVGLVIALAGFASGPAATRSALAAAAIVIAIAGATLTAGAVWSGLVLAPWFATQLPSDVAPPESVAIASVLSYAILGLGAVLLGISARRERSAPGWVVALLIVAGILCLPPMLPARYTLVVVAVALLLVVGRDEALAAARRPAPAAG
jgi:hypothetical protein